ncbi:uncharacterized protein LOC133030386 [Cannabis sativa]|uniref:uncharacterized protein LOC133030386 n=1 Tax=Cannabis sativa TaxID=3483 RepID=UPI0029C9E9BE|nr:uncharacterized protein LOC133030386 [Cannabis sativa]
MKCLTLSYSLCLFLKPTSQPAKLMISSIFIFPSTPSSYSFISHSSTPAIVLETTCQGNDRGSQFSKVVTKLKGMARKYNRKYKKRKSSTPYQKGLTFSKVMPKGAAKNTTFSTNEEGIFYKEITENIKEVADNRKELSENRKELLRIGRSFLRTR